MATLVFSAVGTALGGPLGGALGALIGNQIDRTIAGTPKREGPRLKELAVTTSSYGTTIPRHYGRVRAPGTIIWATNLRETRERSNGSKSSPSITNYAYSISFAVALSSRPIQGVRRMWAEGNLLRGSSGDLKVGGQLRIYNGHGDQDRDPLIAADRGPECPAFRGLAYCVFEDLQIGDFGNRIPSLTFEVIADDGAISLAEVVEDLGSRASAARPLSGLIGFSDEGGPLAASLALIDQLYPISCHANGDNIRLEPANERSPEVRVLPEASVDVESDAFGGLAGRLNRRESEQRDIPDGLRYYEVERDYQPGLQRAAGRARPGRTSTLEFPGVLSALPARQLCDELVQRAEWASDQLLWRIAEIDPSTRPGRIVSVPGHGGLWRIESWEWRSAGVELELRRVPPYAAKQTRTDAGVSLAPKDALATPTIVVSYELPGDGLSQGERNIFAAVSSASDGWTGAALYSVEEGALNYLQASGSERSVVGTLTTAVEPSDAILIDRQGHIDVELASSDFALTSTTVHGLAQGHNRALVGDEILQFAAAVFLGSKQWRLSGLLRGRGGTEAAAHAGHDPGAPFVLLDERPVALAASLAPPIAPESIAAIGLADPSPVVSSIRNSGVSHRPLTPVHARVERQSSGVWRFSWTRRARGAWAWPDNSEVPLGEENERYIVGVGDTEIPELCWETVEPLLKLPPELVADLNTSYAGQPVWVRQVGTVSASDPLLLFYIS